MPSYKIAPVPEDRIAIDTLEEGIKATSAFNSDAELKSGMLPRTFTEGTDGICWVEYGQQTYYDRPTLRGPVETKRADLYDVIFLQNGYVAVEKGTKQIQEAILTTLPTVMDIDMKLEVLEFNEDDLRTVIEESNRVQRIDVSPDSITGPDHVSAHDRADLRKTDWFDQYSADPFEQVRVELPEQNVHVDVGFDDTGRITLYGREIEMGIQADAMRYLTDEIIDPYRAPSDFQGTLGSYK